MTIEPNTAFHHRPPRLPDDDLAWAMQQQCGRLLNAAGFEQYEISAWARKDRQCRHNLNYWRYGDFVGIGAGAHGKISLPAIGQVRRRIRHRHPMQWMKQVAAGDGVADDKALESSEIIFEYFLNHSRLPDGIRPGHFEARTGVAWKEVAPRVRAALEKGLLIDENGVFNPSDQGWRFGNEIQAMFLP